MVGAAVMLGLSRRTEKFQRAAVVVVSALVLAVWFTQMRG